MQPARAFTSHLAKFAFTPSPTKLIPTPTTAPARPLTRPARLSAPVVRATSPGLGSAPPPRPKRSNFCAASRHFSSALAHPPAAVNAKLAVKAEQEGDPGGDPGADVRAAKKPRLGKSKKKPARAYADPSVYAHLGGVPDTLEGNLRLVLCGQSRPYQHLGEWPPPNPMRS